MTDSKKEEIQRAIKNAGVISIVGVLSFIAACVIILTVPAWTLAFYSLLVVAVVCFEFSAIRRVQLQLTTHLALA